MLYFWPANHTGVGVIKRQSLKNSIVNYVGLGIGAISTLFIYSLDTETYGLAQFLLKMGALLVPFATLGIISLTIRFFPEFTARDGSPARFLGLLLLGLTVTLSSFFLFTHFFEAQIYALLGRLNFNIELYESYGRYGFLLCILISLILFFEAYIRNYNRITIQAILTNLLPKVALPTIFLLLVFDRLDKLQFVQGILFYHLLTLFGLIFYLYRLRGLRVQWPGKSLDAPLARQMLSYASFGILGTLGISLAVQIDAIMVPSLIDTRSNGIYMIAAFIAGAIEIPYKAINAIAAPIISKAWKRKDMPEIAAIYKKSSNNLVAAGLLLFVLIWISLDDLFLLTPNPDELVLGKQVVLFLGLAKIVDMFTSVNGSIISFSRYYRFMLLALILMAILNIWLNFLLIPVFSFIGPAIATLISLSIFNLSKLLFIWTKFRMHPFNRQSLGLLLVGALLLILGLWMPVTSIPLINILLRSIVCGLLFIFMVFRLKLAPDLQELSLEILDRFLRYRRRDE